MTIEAFAKVNLTLEVLGKRPDGFHALRSVVLPIGLGDTLTFTPAERFSTDTGYDDDLILKAVRALARDSKRTTASNDSKRTTTSNDSKRTTASGDDDLATCEKYAIHVEKRIPAGGGLGGGSADAAATLLALNALWGLGKTPEELAAIGAQVGSDVPALVLANHYRAPVLMEGRGEVVSLLEGTAPNAARRTGHGSAPFWLVLANPGVASSTPAVYAQCKPQVTNRSEILYTIASALQSQEIGHIASAMMNDLQEPAIALYPAIGEALKALGETGVSGAMMSGSGSTVFGLVPTEEQGRKIVALLADRGLRAWSVAACPVV